MGHQSRDYYYGHSDAKKLPLPPGPPSAHKKMNLKRSDGKKYPHDVTMSPAPAYTGKIKSKMFQNLKAMRGRCSPMEVDPPQKQSQSDVSRCYDVSCSCLHWENQKQDVSKPKSYERRMFSNGG
ncbi:hypothetical protein PBY51_012454 [Eleginops maclovinus]|uniref:Uncharacterized protein n=1 Tax=Eleginops maclovinus TaxID=56733 RepID=A0AAN7XXP1_ELEMC|nr:hypothetical protein PBY51_012454 [Eleginops maclovinus]